MGEIVVACQDAAVTLGGIPHVIITGTTMADTRHEIVRDYPSLWKPLDVHYDVDEPEPKAPAARAAARKGTGQ